MWPSFSNVFFGFIGVLLGYIAVTTMLVVWPKRDGLSDGGVSDDRGRNPMTATG